MTVTDVHSEPPPHCAAAQPHMWHCHLGDYLQLIEISHMLTVSIGSTIAQFSMLNL